MTKPKVSGTEYATRGRSSLLHHDLSMRLRETEMQTIFRMGCSRTMIVMLHGSEIVLLLCSATVLASAAALLTLRFAASVLRSLLF